MHTTDAKMNPKASTITKTVETSKKYAANFVTHNCNLLQQSKTNMYTYSNI